MTLASPDFAAAMKTRYMDPLNDQVYRSHVLLDRMEKLRNFPMSGNDAVLSLISGRNPGVGSRRDDVAGSTGGTGAKIPAAGKQTYVKATYVMSYHYGRGAVSGQSMRMSRDTAGAFAEALNTEMAGLMESLPDDLNRQVCGIGDGRAATLSAISAHDSQADNTTLFVSGDHIDHLTCRVGDRVHFADITSDTGAWRPASGAVITAITLNSVTTGANTAHLLTLDTTSGDTITVGADALYFGGGETLAAENVSRSQEMEGIQAFIDDGDIGGDRSDPVENGELVSNDASDIGQIDRSANAFWQASVLHNPTSAGTRRPLTEKLMTEAILTSQFQHGGKGLEGYMHPSTWGTLGQVQVGQRIYNDQRDTVEMGWEFINVNGIKMFAERDLPQGNIFLIAMDDIFLLTQNDYEMIDDDGSVLRAADLDRDSWQFVVNRDIAMGARRLRTSVKITDIENTMTIDGTIH